MKEFMIIIVFVVFLLIVCDSVFEYYSFQSDVRYVDSLVDQKKIKEAKEMIVSMRRKKLKVLHYEKKLNELEKKVLCLLDLRINSVEQLVVNGDLDAALDEINDLLDICSTFFSDFSERVDSLKNLISEKKLELRNHENVDLSCKDQIQNKKKTFEEKIRKTIVDERYRALEEEIEIVLKKKGETILNYRRSKKIDDDIKRLKKQSTPVELRKKLSSGLRDINNRYKKGIVPDQQLFHVQYDIDSMGDTDEDRLNCYCFYLAPSKGTVLYPYRRHRVELRGYMEQKFESKIKNALKPYKNYQVLGDVSICVKNGVHPYEPDIAIIEKTDKYGLRIDVEVDEPYSGYEKTPIHFIGCGDEDRDKYLNSLGWIVIRFSEKQVYMEIDKCVEYVKRVLSMIDKNVDYKDVMPSPDCRWLQIQCYLWEKEGYRENLLHHHFEKKENDNAKVSFHLTELEKESLKKVEPAPTSKKNVEKDHTTILKTNSAYERKIVANVFSPQDDDLIFSPEHHEYYKGNKLFRSVSDVITDFFEPFDSVYQSELYAQKYLEKPEKIREEWECKGEESREVGTFLHSQIASFLYDEKINYSTRFVYSGSFVKIDKTISIEKEIEQFKSFYNNRSINPFKIECHICDTHLGIAGTVDLISKRNSKSYEIYDWKRSLKASPMEIAWNNGINGLEGLEDIRYNRYSLQLNLYRYILENNYDLDVAKMYMVVFHSELDDYVEYEIPRMEKEIQIIKSRLK